MKTPFQWSWLKKPRQSTRLFWSASPVSRLTRGRHVSLASRNSSTSAPVKSLSITAGRQRKEHVKATAVLAVALIFLMMMAANALAQTAVPPPPAGAPLRSAAELDQLLAPIALYPDPLIAQMLPAATRPSEIVLADRYVSQGGDPNQIDLQPWDASVKALARYPELLKWMDDNLAWTTDVGQVFLYQEADVMNAIQRLRGQASALGNLQSTPQQTILNENGIIEVVPANPEVIYLPLY